MSSRLDQDREKELTPKRMALAIDSLTQLEIDVVPVDDTCIKFLWKGEWVKFFPYSGWATGKSIKDGRGLQSLLKQLK